MSMRLGIWPRAFLLVLSAAGIASADDPRPATITPLEAAVLRALASNPSTAPYPFVTRLEGGRLVLEGVVGTKAVHDIALRTAMAYTPSIDDRLLIDTAATLRAVPPAAPGMSPGGMGGPAWTATGYSGVPYVYPPPLFGYWDEPFYGFEPPVISYPPWWPALSARRRAEDAAAMAPAQPPGVPTPEVLAGVARANSAQPLPVGTVEMTLDAQGVAVLRGTVGSLEERIGLGKKVSETPGVSEVINLIDVREAPPEEAEQPPPPPAPVAEPPPPPQPNAPPPIDAARPHAPANLADRVDQALARSPALAGHAVAATAQGGVVTLDGAVPSAYEAMVAYRAAEQTPGVRSIVDRLEFPVPEPNRPNPLIERGRPEDVEPYLEAQVQRQVGDDAHIDRVRVNAETLQIRGSLLDEADRPRVEAVLRSMPLLRGYRVEPSLMVR